MAEKKLNMKSNENIVCSICIANYNGMKFIDQCINSVINQKCNFNFEIIVHDDASTDNSVNHIKSNFPYVKLIESKTNVGFCVSNNRMAEIAMGEYILLLNNDAVLFPDALETFNKHLNRQSILSLPQYNAATGELIDIGSTFDPFLNPEPNLNQNKTDVGMVIGACLWISKSLWDELGGFPDWFHTLAEDMYLCCIARLKGHHVKVINNSGFLHWVGSSLGGGKIVKNRLTTSISRRKKSELNKTFVLVLTYPFPFFQLVFPLHILLLISEGIILSLIKKDINIFKSIYFNIIKSLWKNKIKLNTLRKQHQVKKKITASTFFRTFSIVPYKLKMLFKFGLPELY